MALRNTMVTASGLTVANAYTRIENLMMFVKGQVQFDAVTYNIGPEENPVAAITERHSFEVDVNAPLHEQVYEALKTLDKFADAVDC